MIVTLTITHIEKFIDPTWESDSDILLHRHSKRRPKLICSIYRLSYVLTVNHSPWARDTYPVEACSRQGLVPGFVYCVPRPSPCRCWSLPGTWREGSIRRPASSHRLSSRGLGPACTALVALAPAPCVLFQLICNYTWRYGLWKYLHFMAAIQIYCKYMYTTYISIKISQC